MEFVTRRITYNVARIKHGLQKKLTMGNIDAERDWGFSGDYVRAMWSMLQHDTPEDFVIATGVSHTVREFLQIAFARVDLDYREHVETNAELMRPADVFHLRGDNTKARRLLNWEPQVSFEQLVEMMVTSDLDLVSKNSSNALSSEAYQLR